MVLAWGNVPEGRISCERCAKNEDPVGTLDDGIAFDAIIRGETYPTFLLCDVPTILRFLADGLAEEDKIWLYLYSR